MKSALLIGLGILGYKLFSKQSLFVEKQFQNPLSSKLKEPLSKTVIDEVSESAKEASKIYGVMDSYTQSAVSQIASDLNTDDLAIVQSSL